MRRGMIEPGCDDGEAIFTLAHRREQLEFIDDQVTDLIQIARD